MPKAKMTFFSPRKEWVVLIVADNQILDIGCEATKGEALAWADKALAAYTASPGPHLIPDMYDRRAVN